MGKSEEITALNDKTSDEFCLQDADGSGCAQINSIIQASWFIWMKLVIDYKEEDDIHSQMFSVNGEEKYRIVKEMLPDSMKITE